MILVANEESERAEVDRLHEKISWPRSGPVKLLPYCQSCPILHPSHHCKRQDCQSQEDFDPSAHAHSLKEDQGHICCCYYKNPKPELATKLSFAPSKRFSRNVEAQVANQISRAPQKHPHVFYLSNSLSKLSPNSSSITSSSCNSPRSSGRGISHTRSK